MQQAADVDQDLPGQLFAALSDGSYGTNYRTEANRSGQTPCFADGLRASMRPGAANRRATPMAKSYDAVAVQHGGMSTMEETLPGAVAAAVAALRSGDRDAMDRLRTDGYVDRRPQTGELVRGRERMRALEAADPEAPARMVNLRRVTGLDQLWTIEGRMQAATGNDWFTVVILELQGDRIAQATTYDVERLEAPSWRAPHVVRIDPDQPPPRLKPASDLSDADVTRIGQAYLRYESRRDWDQLRRLRSPDWLVEWPQSGERIPSHDADVAVHSAYPGYPDINMSRLSSASEGWELSALYTPIRVHGAGPMIVIEGANTYPSGGKWFVVSLNEAGDGHIRRETAYFARPTEPPAWRTPWVESFDPLAPR